MRLEWTSHAPATTTASTSVPPVRMAVIAMAPVLMPPPFSLPQVPCAPSW